MATPLRSSLARAGRVEKERRRASAMIKQGSRRKLLGPNDYARDNSNRVVVLHDLPPMAPMQPMRRILSAILPSMHRQGRRKQWDMSTV